MSTGQFCTSSDILTNRVQTEEGWLQVCCYSFRGAITSDMSADLMSLSDMPACLATLSDMHAGFIYSDACVCKVLLHQARNLICYKNHQICLQVRCSSHGFEKLISYHPECHLEYIKFWAMHCLHHWDVTSMMFVTQEAVKSAFCMQIPGVCQCQGKFSYICCNKLPFRLNSYFIFIFML